MNKNLTEVVFILDASGSMYDLTKDTIGGFNSMLAEQKKKDEEVLISTVLFNNNSKVIYDRVPLKDVPDMTEKDYIASGCTALIDAMGDAIHHISNVHKYIREEDVPHSTLFIITTDGMENASHKYTSDEVKKMVSEKKEKGWEFAFLGANIDAVETAKGYGIDEKMSVLYKSDKIGTGKSFSAMRKLVNMAVCEDACYDGSWKEDLEEDTKNRNLH